jgi:hypothetical protein
VKLQGSKKRILAIESSVVNSLTNNTQWQQEFLLTRSFKAPSARSPALDHRWPDTLESPRIAIEGVAQLAEQRTFNP